MTYLVTSALLSLPQLLTKIKRFVIYLISSAVL